MSKKPKKSEIVTVESQVVSNDEIARDAFATVRELDEGAREAASFAVAQAILAGVELGTLQKRFGYTRGRPAKDALPKPADTWEECVQKFAGIGSRTTAWRYMTLADEAKRRVKPLKDLAGKSLADLTDDEKTALLKAVRRSVGESTLGELLLDWDLAKPPKKIGGKPDGDGDGENDADPDPAEVARLLISYPVQQLQQAMANPEKFTRGLYDLPKEERLDLQTQLSSALDAITDSIK